MEPSIFHDLVEKLTKYPNVRYEVGKNFFRVFPNNPDGFEVGIRQLTENGFEVSLEGWHEPFGTYEEACKCFAFALSNRCRLKRLRKGTFPFRWTLEYLENAQWREESTTGLFLYPFWRRTTTEFLQNKPLFEAPTSR